MDASRVDRSTESLMTLKETDAEGIIFALKGFLASAEGLAVMISSGPLRFRLEKLICGTSSVKSNQTQ